VLRREGPIGVGPEVTTQPEAERPAGVGGAEVENATRAIADILAPITEVGAEVAFTFWVSGGALTLVSLKRGRGGGQQGAGVDRGTIRHEFETLVGLMSRGPEQYIEIRATRRLQSWATGAKAGTMGQTEGRPPPEARLVPGETRGYTANAYISAVAAATKLTPFLETPLQGASELIVTLNFTDDRVTSSLASFRVVREGNGRVHAEDTFQNELVASILPFTRGFGERTLRMVLTGSHDAKQPHSTWQVAEVGRPEKVPLDEAEEAIAEYRREKAQIGKRFVETSKEIAIKGGIFIAEQAALWVIGGVVARAAGGIIEIAAPELFKIIGAGGKVAAEYLETLVIRLAPAERAEYAALSRKLEAEGLEALSIAERTRLNAIYGRLQQLLGKPLTRVEKRYLRAAMDARYLATKPAAVKVLEESGIDWATHHRLPLEWDHLFPGVDVNAGENLIGLEVRVHQNVGAVWTRFRANVPANKVTAASVQRVAQIIDKYFAKWYDVVPPSQGIEAAAASARTGAVAEVELLIKELTNVP
jgi:hypothetical protein